MKKLLIFGILVIVFIATCGCTEPTAPMTKVIRSNMYTLDRGESIQGLFILGSGNVNGEPSYEYYIQTSDGGYKLKSVDAKECTIFEDENTTPYITATYERERSYRDHVTFDVGDIGDRFIVRSTGETGFRAYDWFDLDSEVQIHIPPNSIIKEYKP